MSTSKPVAEPPKRNIFLPIVLIALTVLGMMVSEIYQGYRHKVVLSERLGQLEGSVQDAHNVRKQFEVLVKGTAELASGGNQNAALIVARLNEAGVEFSPAKN